MKLVYDIDAFREQVRLAENELLARIMKGVQLAAAEIEQEAVDRCPVGDHEGADTVPLAQSITTTIDVTDYIGAKVVGVVGTGLDYAVYVHEGTGIESRTGMGRTHDLPWSYQDDMGNWHTTSGMHPNPFMEDAFNAKSASADEIVKRTVLGR